MLILGQKGILREISKGTFVQIIFICTFLSANYSQTENTFVLIHTFLHVLRTQFQWLPLTFYNLGIFFNSFKLSNDIELVRADLAVDPEWPPMVIVVFHLEMVGLWKTIVTRTENNEVSINSTLILRR